MKWIVLIGSLLLAMPDAVAGKWQTFEKFTLVKDAYFDGDSFHVRAPMGHTYVFRVMDFVRLPSFTTKFMVVSSPEHSAWMSLASAPCLNGISAGHHRLPVP